MTQSAANKHVSAIPRAGRPEGRSETRLLRYLLNGLELVELLAGCASDTHGKARDSTGMLIRALRHGFTPFTSGSAVILIIYVKNGDEYQSIYLKCTRFRIAEASLSSGTL